MTIFSQYSLIFTLIPVILVRPAGFEPAYTFDDGLEDRCLSIRLRAHIIF